MGSDAYESARQTALILLPEIILLLTGIGMMTASPFLQQPRRRWCRAAVWALLAALVTLLAVARQETDIYASVALNDTLSFWARIVLLLTGLIVMGLSHDEPSDGRAGEFFGALLIMNAGAMLVAAANELVFLFVGLELVSMPTYLLLYLSKRNPATQEAATKYFFLSIFASGLLLYGLTFLYGATGISNLKTASFLFERLNEHPPAAARPDRHRLRDGGLVLPGDRRAAALLRTRRLPGVADADRRGAVLGAQGRRLPGDDPRTRLGVLRLDDLI